MPIVSRSIILPNYVIFVCFLLYLSERYLHSRSVDTSSREGTTPRKFKRGNLNYYDYRKNHTDNKSRQGLSSSSATCPLTPKTDISLDSPKIRAVTHTASPNVAPYASQRAYAIILNYIALGIKSLLLPLQRGNQIGYLHHQTGLLIKTDT